MNREVLFRGKRTNNGEWVYGYYFKTPLTDESTGSKPEDGWYFLTGRERHCISRNNCVYEVNPETVGQFTGHYDKNDVMIFEHGIVRIADKYTGLVGWDKHDAAWIVWANATKTVRYADLGSYNDGKYLEVIGNIHENPELEIK